MNKEGEGVDPVRKEGEGVDPVEMEEEDVTVNRMEVGETVKQGSPKGKHPCIKQVFWD